MRERIYNTAVPYAIKRGGMAVTIIFADGTEQDIDGRVLYDTQKLDPESGDLITIKETWVEFATVELDQALSTGNITAYKIPPYPGSTTVQTMIFDQSKSIVDGDSLGFKRIPLTIFEQS